jgi:hypothetical protein
MAKKIPLRKCVGCGDMKEKRQLMRALKSDDGSISLDTTGKKNGRGAYVCMNAECLKAARTNKGLERSFKMSIPEDGYDTLEREFDKLGEQ